MLYHIITYKQINQLGYFLPPFPSTTRCLSWLILLFLSDQFYMKELFLSRNDPNKEGIAFEAPMSKVVLDLFRPTLIQMIMPILNLA